MFYAADNSYSSETDIGFVNTWYVLAFETRRTRDEYVNTAPGMAARSIKRNEVVRYAAMGGRRRPQPFTGEYWGVVPDWRYVYGEATAPIGYVGHVEVVEVDPWEPHTSRARPVRFYG